MEIDQEKYKKIKDGKGFIAALDQSGGSSAKTLELYGITSKDYSTEEEMFGLIHNMRKRIIKSESFSNDFILGVILFEKTMENKIDNQYTADYLWNKKQIISFLKIDQGLDAIFNGVQLMKPITNLDGILEKALKKNIFGTKMRSLIKEDNEKGIVELVNQQFDLAREIIKKGLIPIVEPEVDINALNKENCEYLLRKQIDKHLASLSRNEKVMFKLTLPSKNNFYEKYTTHPSVIRVLALSGGYSRQIANEKLSKNKKIIASFSRALLEGLSINQTSKEFDVHLSSSIKSIYETSINKKILKINQTSITLVLQSK